MDEIAALESPLAKAMHTLSVFGWHCSLTPAEGGKVRLVAERPGTYIEVVGRHDVVAATLFLLAAAPPA